MSFPTLPATSPEWIFLLLMGVTLFAPVLARRVKLPGLLGLIVVGIVIGPNVLGLLDRDGFVEILGGAGLLFLMFMAGLELDLRASLGERRTDTLLFGALTFALPLVVGTVALLIWGFTPLAAVLIASCWSSHTLVTYPIFQRLGIVQHRAVATAIGATMVTNVSALVVLAVVIALEVGGTGVGSWVVLGGGLAALGLVTLWGVPRLTRWFFAGLGDDRLSQVLYVFVVLFAASALASMVELEPIVGAFFAGLGMNEHVPKTGVLGERLVFLGDAVLIPVFLVSVGMIITPAALFSSTTIALLALTFTLQSLGGKLLAALTFGRLRGLTRDETGAMFSLTAAEAAATLAAIFVGFQAGLFGQEVVDAVVVVIMVTCLTSTVLADRFAPRLPRPARSRQLGSQIVVPIANPANAGRLTELAAAIAASDSGTVTSLSVLGRDVTDEQLDQQREGLALSEAAALRGAVEATSRIRVDDSPIDGIAHEVIERGGTAVLMGWKGYATRREHLFGSTTDRLLRQVQVPVLLCRPGPDERIERIVTVSGRNEGAPDRGFVDDIVRRLANHLRAQRVAVDGAEGAGARGSEAVTAREVRTTLDVLTGTAEPGDLLVLRSSGHVNGHLEAVARANPERTILIVVEH